MDFLEICRQLSEGMLTSIEIFLTTVILSMPLGLLISFVRMSRFKILQWIARIYISIMRGTPLMLQLMVVFYGPYFFFHVRIPTSYRLPACLIGFVINYAAYFAEIFRSGIESIPVGQQEAAQVLGYSKAQTFVHIIFPQMVKRVLPPVTNEVITLVKDTSLAFALSVTEMFTIAKQIAASNASMVPYIAAALFYYVFNMLVALLMEKCEKKMSYYR
jgi:polar amino acid transport system permease protein